MFFLERRKKIGYLGFVGKGNLGDDLLYESISNLLRPYIPRSHRFYPSRFHNDLSRYECFICGGGTLLSALDTGWMVTLRRVREKKVPLIIFGTGVQPENMFIQEKKSKTSLENLCAIIDYADLVGVRGPDSRNELTNLGCAQSKIQIIGDPVIGHQGIDVLPEKISSKLNPIKIGVCVGYSTFRTYVPLTEMVGNITKICRKLIEKGCWVILFPMRREDLKIQEEIAKSINSCHCKLVKHVPTLREVLRIYQELTMLIAGKLHPGIIAAACALPFVVYAHEAKCIDFAKSICCEHLVVRQDAPMPALINKIMEVIDNSNQLTEELAEKKTWAVKTLKHFSKQTGSILQTKLVAK